MLTETKNCQNCKQEFVIEPDDFAFYEKMSAQGGSASGGKVPPPTFCPECRNQRRFAWRNERSLYKRKDDLTGEEIISVFSTDKPFVVYSQKNWWSDRWDPMERGRDYDFTRPFFNQFRELLEQVPAPAITNVNPSNSDYCSYAESNKDCYLNFAVGFDERVCYSNRVGFSKDSLDLLGCAHNELCYENVNCTDSYHLCFSQNCKSCTESYFLYNCRNCNNCVGCVNLVSKSYYIFNQPHTKEEYKKRVNEMGINSRRGLAILRNQFNEIISQSIRRYANIINSPNSTGDNIFNSKNCKASFEVMEKGEDSAYLVLSYDLRDSHDGLGLYRCEMSYENIDTNLNSGLLSSITVYHSNNIFYSINCHGSNNLFSCIGLRNKNYCILNKQYTKEEYEELIPKIVQHMNDMAYTDKKGRVYKYGEFFPSEISPFAYNETIAQEYYSLSKEQADEQGYNWKEEEIKNYKITKPPNDLPDKIQDISEEILKETIGCEHKGKCNEKCTGAFKIVLQELQFYKKMNLPLPALCPNCRHYQRLKQKTPMKLWRRQCMCDKKHSHHVGRCANEFKTPYSPEGEEIIYCESCYQQEVV